MPSPCAPTNITLALGCCRCQGNTHFPCSEALFAARITPSTPPAPPAQHPHRGPTAPQHPTGGRQGADSTPRPPRPRPRTHAPTHAPTHTHARPRPPTHPHPPAPAHARTRGDIRANLGGDGHTRGASQSNTHTRESGGSPAGAIRRRAPQKRLATAQRRGYGS